MNRPWTKEDDEYLSEHYPYEEAHKIARILFARWKPCESAQDF